MVNVCKEKETKKNHRREDRERQKMRQEKKKKVIQQDFVYSILQECRLKRAENDGWVNWF
jgi:hypothetical protein